MFYIAAWIMQSLLIPSIYKNLPLLEQLLVVIANGMLFISIAFILEIKDFKKEIIKELKRNRKV